MNIQNVHEELTAAQEAKNTLRNLEAQAARLPELQREAARLVALDRLEALKIPTREKCAALQDDIDTVYSDYQATLEEAMQKLFDAARLLRKVRIMELELKTALGDYTSGWARYHNEFIQRGYGQSAASEHAADVLARPITPRPTAPERDFGIGKVLVEIANNLTSSPPASE